MKLAPLWILVVLAAGCTDAFTDPVEAEDTTVEPEPMPEPPEYALQNLLNDTMDFGSVQASASSPLAATVPEGTQNLTIDVLVRYDCPVNHREAPALVIVDPSGAEEHVAFTTGELQPAGACPFAPETFDPVETLQPHPEPGEWEFRVEGDCMCTARIVLDAEVPI